MSSEPDRFFLPDFLFCQNTSFCKAFLDLSSQEEVGEAEGYSLVGTFFSNRYGEIAIL
jgi:hypothetical protein